MIKLEKDAYGHWSWSLLDGEEIVSMMGGFDSRKEAAEGVRRAFNVMGAEHEMEQALSAAMRDAADL